MNGGFGHIIQFMFFIVVILVMAKIFGFADNGFAVIAACVLGGIAYGAIYFVSSKFRDKKETKNTGNALKRGGTRARKNRQD